MTSAPNMEDELRAAGFSRRTANALVYSSRVESLEALMSGPWGDRNDTTSLCWELSVTPGLGPKGVAEVLAFREGRDPRTAVAPGPIKAILLLGPEEVAALDAWIAKQPEPVSRPEAIRAFVAAGLDLGNGG